MTALLHSRKFMVLVLDTVISMILFSVGRYWPSAMDDVRFFTGALQPIFAMMIAGIAWEDAAEKSAVIVDHVRVLPEPEQPEVQ